MSIKRAIAVELGRQEEQPNTMTCTQLLCCTRSNDQEQRYRLHQSKDEGGEKWNTNGTSTALRPSTESKMALNHRGMAILVRNDAKLSRCDRMERLQRCKITCVMDYAVFNDAELLAKLSLASEMTINYRAAPVGVRDNHELHEERLVESAMTLCYPRK